MTEKTEERIKTFVSVVTATVSVGFMVGLGLLVAWAFNESSYEVLTFFLAGGLWSAFYSNLREKLDE